jgi:hypothetical protein
MIGTETRSEPIASANYEAGDRAAAAGALAPPHWTLCGYEPVADLRAAKPMRCLDEPMRCLDEPMRSRRADAVAAGATSKAARVAVAARGAPIVRVLGLHLRAAIRTGRRQIARLTDVARIDIRLPRALRGYRARRGASGIVAYAAGTCLDDRGWSRHRRRRNGRDRNKRTGRQRSARESLHEIRLPRPSDSHLPDAPPGPRIAASCSSDEHGANGRTPTAQREVRVVEAVIAGRSALGQRWIERRADMDR